MYYININIRYIDKNQYKISHLILIETDCIDIICH